MFRLKHWILIKSKFEFKTLKVILLSDQISVVEMMSTVRIKGPQLILNDRI